ncbi:conserved hypothetical protein [Alteracholeplasma palmae J233]|uniref:Bax inhibitor-1/YccA family protein n=1 Tax=Alteracholeplasma palmae (strain ATCC 49389 / J233) TaxID=1318466 RepID=U4KP48_ALTPJ|nr:Bax inhibitor-1/YccA family protein [Alteracholeplasma palmae]CCV63980.1 conserved hypothetical protein [Alteracholeplasma palmae J233]
MRSTNPVFKSIRKEQEENISDIRVTSNTSTYKGIALKTIILALITIITGASSLILLDKAPNLVIGVLLTGGIISFIAVMVGTRSTKMAMPMSILYAFIQGVVYGTITLLIQTIPGFEGVGIIALTATLTIFLVMMVLYYTGVVKASPLLVKIVIGTLIASILATFVIFIIGLFAPAFIASIQANVPLMLLVGVVFIILGALMLAMDFANADAVVKSYAPKEYEWQVTLGFMVTLVWLYVQILRVLIILLNRRD